MTGIADTTAHRTRNGLGIRNLSSSNPNSRATYIKSQDKNNTGKECDEELELHEMETEEIHSSFNLQNFGTELSDGTEIPLEGVPKIVSNQIELEVIKKKEKSQLKSTESKSAKAKAEKKAKTQTNSEESKQAAIELEKKKEISFRYSLRSYLTMCMQQNMVYKAMMLLRNYHAEEKYFKSSDVYDAVLKEASARCSWKLIKEIVTMMEEDEIPFSLNSFAACFICLGRRSEREKGLEPLSENLLDKMVSCELDVGDIFTRCKFTSNHRDLAVKGVRLAIPEFQPSFPSIPHTYTTPLLTNLNDLNIESPVSSAIEGLLSEDRY